MAALVAVVVLFAVIGWIVNTIVFFVKLALVVVFVGLILRFLTRKR